MTRRAISTRRGGALMSVMACAWMLLHAGTVHAQANDAKREGTSTAKTERHVRVRATVAVIDPKDDVRDIISQMRKSAREGAPRGGTDNERGAQPGERGAGGKGGGDAATDRGSAPRERGSKARPDGSARERGARARHDARPERDTSEQRKATREARAERRRDGAMRTMPHRGSSPERSAPR